MPTSRIRLEAATKPRRVTAKVEWHPGELYPRVGFIVTNLSHLADRVVAFYNKRGTGERWIKEGKGAIKWTRLSCRMFAANAVRLQLHALAYNLGKCLRTLPTPEPIKDFSLTSLQAEADQSRREGREPWPPRSPCHGKCSRRFCGSSRNCGRSHNQRQLETDDDYLLRSYRQEECARMPGKMTKLSPLDCRPGPDVTASDRMRICLAGRPEYHAS